MKKPKYFIMTNDGRLTPVLKRVYPFTYRGINLFARKKRSKWWTITNTDTGLLVSEGLTKQEAIENARKKIRKYGVAKTKKLIRIRKKEVMKNA